VGAKDVVVHKFGQFALRSGDIRRAVLYTAAASEIDAIVITINPFWLLNDHALFMSGNSRASLLGYPGLDTIDYLVAASIFRPSELLWQALETVFPFFQRRYEASKKYYIQANLAFPLRDPKFRPREDKVMDWLKTLFPNHLESTPSALRKFERLRAALLMGNASDQSVAARIFKANLKTLIASQKPVVFYVQPLDPLVQQDPEAMQRLNVIISTVKRFVDEKPVKRLVLSTETVFMLESAHHRDLYHLNQGQEVVENVAYLLERASGLQLSRGDLSSMYQPSVSK
jgi:hypothetical protein